jgi:hypothetical protein
MGRHAPRIRTKTDEKVTELCFILTFKKFRAVEL